MHTWMLMGQDGTATPNREESESDRDVESLQDSWVQVDLEVDGVSNPPDPHSPPGATTTFADNQFAVRTADGTLLLAGTFELDATTTPKSITWIDSMGEDIGKRLPAIYTLDGDRFVFIAGDAAERRPRVFKTTPGQTMRTFVRRR
jgi:uncharacterized protein (TIGR03067 family)